MSRSSNGTRMIEGREYLLAGRTMVWDDEDYAAYKDQAKYLERDWEIVKVRRANGYDATIWVHGSER
jgi:hypothetical protein